MKRVLLCVAVALASLASHAVGTVYVTLSYKWNGVAKQDNIILGVGGKVEPDYDNTGSASANYVIGEWDYSFNSATGLDLRLGIFRGYKQFAVGRQETSTRRYLYYPKGSGGIWGMAFGETYELDISSDYSKTNQLTDVVITTTPFHGRKITNMTGGDIRIGSVWDVKETIPNNSAVLLPSVVVAFDSAEYNTSWECHSEQDWETTFLPYSGFYMKLFPQFANLVFYKPSTIPTIHALEGALVFGDMNASSNSNILYGASGYPLYSIRDFLDSVTVMTEWVFDQSQIPSPHAFINGVDVCQGHSTSHIIDYYIVAQDNWSYDGTTLCYNIDFTMSLTGSASVSSPSVVQRCWVNEYASYDDAPASERASSAGHLGDVATFRLSQNIVNGELTLAVR